MPSSCAGDRAGREAGAGLDQLVAPAIVRWPLRPGIGDLDWRGATPPSASPPAPEPPAPAGGGPPPPSASPPAPEPPARSGRKPGKQRGSKGIWRCEPLQAERDENHY